jgi:LysM repeat protein
MGRNRWGKAFGLAAAAIAVTAPGTAQAELPHVVQPGETLWSISAANNLTTRTVAVYNGLSEDSQVVAGETIMVPTVEEGAAALAAAPTSTTSSSSSSTATSSTGGGVEHTVQPGETLSGVAAANGLSTADLAAANGLSEDSYLIAGTNIQIPSAAGTSTTSSSSSATVDPAAELAPEAAASWSSMRAEAQSVYGIDLYPSAGPLSVLRTYEEQAHLYDLFLEGKGAPANPPGTSAHEMGIAVDLAEPEMRSVIDEIGGKYGWVAPHSNEWWHVEYWG